MTDALYVPRGPLLEPTRLVTSPWSETTSHGGPPAALLARAIECLDPPDLHLARLTVEILRPIPMVPLVATAEVVRPGRRVQFAVAELTDRHGTVLLRGEAWRIRHRPPLPMPSRDAPPLPLPPPETAPEPSYRFCPWTHFPTDAQDARIVGGDLGGAGRTAMWFRLRVPLVAGEAPTPEQRFVAAADSANGMSRHAEATEMLFVNPDLTVAFARAPHGDWVGMDATSHWDPTGRGLSDTALYDLDGFVGRANQTLFIDERPPGPATGQPTM